MKSWNDVYLLPLRKDSSAWVYDDRENFVFQFVFNNEGVESYIMDCINGIYKPEPLTSSFVYKNGYIQTTDGVKLILIRGWGNLTGVGAMNLPEEEAKNIQDTFAAYIISRLTPDKI